MLSLLVPRESTPACMALSFPVSLRGGEGFSPGAAAVSPLRSRTAGLLERMLDFLRACTRPAPSAHEAPRSWRIFKNKQNLTRHVCAGELCTHTFSSRYSIPGLKPAKVVRACSCPNHSRLTPPSSIQPAQPWQTCMVYSLYARIQRESALERRRGKRASHSHLASIRTHCAVAASVTDQQQRRRTRVRSFSRSHCSIWVNVSVEPRHELRTSTDIYIATFLVGGRGCIPERVPKSTKTVLFFKFPTIAHVF